MRRSDREITDKDRVFKILEEAKILRIAYADKDGLTMLPITFTPVDENGEWVLIFHGATAGRKYEAWKGGHNVVFEAEAGVSPILSDNPPNNSWTFETVVGHGRIELVADPDKKRAYLEALTHAFNPSKSMHGLPPDLSWVACYALHVTDWTAKERKA